MLIKALLWLLDYFIFDLIYDFKNTIN